MDNRILGPERNHSGEDCWGDTTRSFVKAIPRDIRPLSERDLDSLERAAQSLAASIRLERRRRDRCKTTRWRRGGPQPELTGRFYFDHGYTLVGPEGRLEWIGEPYDLDEGDLWALLGFVADGRRIEIRADLATHFPGHTLFVRLWQTDIRVELGQ